MLVGKIILDFLIVIIEVRFFFMRVCVEYKYFNFISLMRDFIGLLFYRIDGELKGEFGSGLYFFRECLVC